MCEETSLVARRGHTDYRYSLLESQPPVIWWEQDSLDQAGRTGEEIHCMDWVGDSGRISRATPSGPGES